MADKFLSVPEAAEYLGKAVSTLSNWRKENVGPPYYRLHGTIAYRLADIESWLESNRVAPESKAVAQ